MPETDAGRPVGFGAAHSCYPYKSHGITVLTEAAKVELYEDGVKTSTATVLPLQAATMTQTKTSATNVTVVCLSAAGSPTGSGSIIEPKEASKIELTLDAPSVLKGSFWSATYFSTLLQLYLTLRPAYCVLVLT